MQPILNDAARATGVTVRLDTSVATLTGAQEVADGTADGKYDAAWFASNDYLELLNGGLARLDGSSEIMATPVVLALRTSAVRRLGWEGKRVTWGDIARAAAAGQFSFGMANPGYSNSGLMGLVSAATSLAGHGAALNGSNEVDAASGLLSGMFHDQVLKADSAAELAAEYAASLRNPASPRVDGLIDYESQLLTLIAKYPQQDPLTLIYPSDGVVSATYPLSVLASAPAAAKAAYGRLVSYLRTPSAQRAIMSLTHRRPIIPGVQPAGGLHAQSFQLPFPATVGTVTYLISVYDSKLVRASQTVYVLDTSASMNSLGRLAALKRALQALTGTDTSLAGQVATFHAREQVTLMPFSDTPRTPTTFTIPPSGAARTLDAMRTYIEGLTARGHTAVYDSLARACTILGQEQAAAPGRSKSIVLITDGESNKGMSRTQFLAFYQHLPCDAPVYIVAVGQARLPDLAQLAAATGGVLFDAKDQPARTLLGIFQDIRGYQ